MPTKPRPWSNSAENARLDTILFARDISRLLSEALDSDDRSVRYKKMMNAINLAFEIERTLIQAKHPEIKDELDTHKPVRVICRRLE